jgi:hypothetical protein
VAALRCRALLEDTILEPTARGSPMVVTEVILRRSSARLAPCPSLVELPWRCCSVCEQLGLVPGGGRLPVVRRRSSIGTRVKNGLLSSELRPDTVDSNSTPSPRRRFG